jgi:hypothetical protein
MVNDGILVVGHSTYLLELVHERRGECERFLVDIM